MVIKRILSKLSFVTKMVTILRVHFNFTFIELFIYLFAYFFVAHAISNKFNYETQCRKLFKYIDPHHECTHKCGKLYFSRMPSNQKRYKKALKKITHKEKISVLAVH